jgi:hypothetical protein
MGAVSLLAKLAESQKLPLGHYGRKEAQEAVDKEYHACHEQVKVLVKQYRIKKRYFEPQEAVDFCAEMCERLGSKPLKYIVIRSKDVGPCVGAHYDYGTIHFPHNYIQTSTLLHELTHHLAVESHYHGHGKIFLELQALLYEAAADHLKKV